MIDKKEIFKYIEEKYNVTPEYLFLRSPDCAVFRNKKNNKWFGIIMNIEKRKIGINEEGSIDIINLKGEPEFNSILRSQNHIIAAYHMNKKHWISVLLNHDFPITDLFEMIDWSYDLIAKRN